MPEFLVEAYSPLGDHEDCPTAEDVAEAARRVAREGRSVRLLHAILLPDDETCLYLFEAEWIADVAEAANRAGLRFERSCPARSAWTSGTARRFAPAP